jgi:hypothetical protein
LENINKSDKGIIILGDFNINIMEQGPGHNQLLDISNIYNLALTIYEPIRVTDSTASAVDQIMTNLPEHQYQVVVI